MSVPQMTDSVSDLNGNKAILKDLLKVKLSFHCVINSIISSGFKFLKLFKSDRNFCNRRSVLLYFIQSIKQNFNRNSAGPFKYFTRALQIKIFSKF